MASAPIDSINIRPGVSILSVLKHLNYKPWFALAEFVDNSLQSYLDHKEELHQLEGSEFKLHVSIELNPEDNGKITIMDNAAGIYQKDYARAFRPAALPKDDSGLCEFGMGMKSAACWFADKFAVRTGALGETTAREVFFDINKIVRDSMEELTIKNEPKDKNIHFTSIVLSELHKPIQGKTIGKIREHLASIYREFFRRGILELKFNGELLSYEEPQVLVAPYFRNASDPALEWKKEIDFDFGRGLKVKGFAALRETASVSNAGFSLFRRSRVIQGSGDEGYRPEYIFKKSNSFTYQRLFGELHLEGFDVSHTKDGFSWKDDNEEVFLELLEEHLNSEPKPLIKQAEGYRVNPRRTELRHAAETASKQTANVIEHEAPKVMEPQIAADPDSYPPPLELQTATRLCRRTIDIKINEKPWRIVLELSDDPAVSDWIEICDHLVEPGNTDGIRKVGIRMALIHPFMQRFCGADEEKLEGLLRVASAIVLAEITARESGVKQVGTVRRNINQFLRDALSKP